MGQIKTAEVRGEKVSAVQESACIPDKWRQRARTIWGKETQRRTGDGDELPKLKGSRSYGESRCCSCPDSPEIQALSRIHPVTRPLSVRGLPRRAPYQVGTEAVWSLMSRGSREQQNMTKLDSASWININWNAVLPDINCDVTYFNSKSRSSWKSSLETNLLLWSEIWRGTEPSNER